VSREEARIREAVRFLGRRLPARPEQVVIVGSGMSGLRLGRVRARLPYRRIPGFPRPAVPGHPGELTFEGRAAVLRGRTHFYEGASMDDVVRPVRILARLGARLLVVTNAAGAILKPFRRGDLMLITDHLNLMGVNPLRGGSHFIDLTEAYDPGLRRAALRTARRLGIRLKRGVYAAMAGPSYETPAEIRMLRALGADAVGMSTVPEVLAGRQEGMRVLGLSCLANPAAGLGRSVSHDDVLEGVKRAEKRLGALLGGILSGKS
jgi:purine-nucleoside phosphorylase